MEREREREREREGEGESESETGKIWEMQYSTKQLRQDAPSTSVMSSSAVRISPGTNLLKLRATMASWYCCR